MSATHLHRFFLALLATVAVSAGSSVAPMNADAAGVYWGSYIKGDTYGYSDAPWDTRSIDAFESHAGKRTSIIHWGQAWYWGSRGGYQPFQRDMAEKVRLRGSIPMITWTSADQDKGNSTDQPNFQLSDISNGQHDAYIRRWARDAKAWGHPLFVRFDHEMNGGWFNWSETKNGNSKGQFAPMWRHVVDIFRQEGASNVTWVWAPNRTWSLAPVSISEIYPGATYVDWAGISAYNWGTNPAKPDNVWQSFGTVFKETYDALRQVAPGKPLMVAETGASEYGGSKAGWIKDGLQVQLPSYYPQIKAFVWFNWDAPATYGKMDWVIESSGSATSAFAAGIGSSYYAANSFASLPLLTKVQPLATSSGDLVRNGSFETTGSSPWYSPWTIRNDLGATNTRDTGTRSVGAASFRVTLPTSSSSQPWAVQLKQSGVALSAGATYRLAFSAKSSFARPVSILVQASTSPWTVYTKHDPSLGTGWARYAYTFTAPVTTSTSMVAVNLAAASGTVWLDDVSLARQ